MLSRARPWQFFAISIVLLPYFYALVSSQRSGSTSRRPSPCDQWDICSQRCEDTSSGSNVTCSCLNEFHLGDDNRSCVANDPTLKIVYALKNSVRIWNVNRSSSISIVENKGQTVGVTIDVANALVYWTDVSEGKESVHRANVNGQGPVETVVDTGLLLPEGIAFDWVTGNIYIADSNRSHIVVCRGDGKMCTVLIREMSMDKPREVALHPIEGLMFWTDWGEKSSIMRAWMDGSKPIPLIVEDVKWPNSLAVDHGRNRLYWTDAFHDKIETVTLTGEDRKVVNEDKVNHPFSLKVFGDMIFWSDWELKSIQTCTKFACKSDIRTVIDSLHTPHGLAVFHPAAQPKVAQNICQSKCSHICVLSGKTGYTCRCPAGYKLDRSKKTCIDDDSKAKILIGHDSYIKLLRFDSIGRDVDIVEEVKVPGFKNIGAMVYNPINDTIFVSDLTHKGIYEYSFTTRQLHALSTRHLDSVKSMGFDPVGENLYWVDSTRRKIEVMSCRTLAKALIAMEADHPQSIVVVPEERYIFVALTGARGGRILRYNMNGYNRRTLVRTNRGEPISLTYNAEVKKIFWIDSEGESIEQVTLNGRSQLTLQQSGTPFGMTSFGNRVFWTDRYTQLMHSMAVFGLDTNESPVFVGHADDKYTNGTVESYIKGNFLAGLAIMHKDLTVYENLTRYHECSTSREVPKCSHICLFSAELDIGTCVCPEGMQLNDDRTTCSWTQTCLTTQFQCNDNRCIDSDWVCDGVPDCAGGEDEKKCQSVSPCSGETEFMCESDQRCIHSNWKCDGERDCPEGEDEFNCGKLTHSCNPDTDFQCNNGRCIPIAWKCDHHIECPEGEDEVGCNHTCPIGTFQCKKNLDCISVDWVCDGEADCSDGSDEHGHCEVPCSSNSFRCLDHHCIPGVLACNGVYDCADNSDELDCNATTALAKQAKIDAPSVEDELTFNRANGSSRNSGGFSGVGSNGLVIFESCRSDQFTCFTGECLSYTSVCDTKIDCPDGSDEGYGCDLSCKENECPHQCLRTPTGSKCLCNVGYVQDKRNKRGCVDVDECGDGNPCQHICINTRGSFKCSCHEGYALRSDQKRCKSKTQFTKPEYTNPADRVENISPEKSQAIGEPGFRGSSAGWWVFGIFLILFMVGGAVGYVFHRKRLHPKILFERYAHHIPVKFNIRRGVGREGAGDEETYQDFSDGRSSADHAGLLSNMDGSI